MIQDYEVFPTIHPAWSKRLDKLDFEINTKDEYEKLVEHHGIIQEDTDWEGPGNYALFKYDNTESEEAGGIGHFFQLRHPNFFLRSMDYYLEQMNNTIELSKQESKAEHIKRIVAGCRAEKAMEKSLNLIRASRAKGDFNSEEQTHDI